MTSATEEKAPDHQLSSSTLERSGTPRNRDALLWLIGLVGAIAIPIAAGGKINLAEVAFLFLIFVILSTLRGHQFLRHLWVFALLWSGAQVVSNIVHDQGFVTAPVLAGPTVALLATGLYWMHLKLGISVPDILIAVGIGWVALEVVAGGALSSSNPWKYHLATPLAVAVLAFAYKRQWKRMTLVVLLFAFAAASRFYDSRVQTALFLVAAIALLLVTSDRVAQRKRSGKTLAFLLLGAVAVYLAYPSLAMSGYLGDRAYRQQVSYEAEDANFVLATRIEFPQVAYLVTQNPVLGIGSYAPVGRAESAASVNFVDDYISHVTPSDRNYLTRNSDGSWVGYRAHSSAMSSALYAGVLALPFWIFLLVRNARGVVRFARGQVVVPALFIYLCGLTTWDVFFSPLTNRTHMSIGVMMFLLAVVFQVQRDPQPSEELTPVKSRGSRAAS